MKVHFAIPGDIDTPTGGYGYDRKLIEQLRQIGWEVEHVVLPDGFPNPDEAALVRTRTAFDALPDGSLVMVDGLAFGVIPELVADISARLRLVALVHHPLADETGLDAEQIKRFALSETEALRHAREIVCTSTTTAKRLRGGFGVRRERLTVALPGTDRHPPAFLLGDPPVILCLAALVRRKAHEVLIEALGQLKGRRWCCRIVGPDDRDPKWTTILTAEVARLGLHNRVVFVGPVSDPEIELRAADIFALPSRHEGYGMAFAEAMAHGLPIVACAAGAVPEVVPPSAGLLVPPDNADAFADALASLLDDAEKRKDMAAASWRAGQALPDWHDTAKAVAGALAKAAA